MLSLLRAQIQSLVKVLRSCKPHSVARKKERKEKKTTLYLEQWDSRQGLGSVSCSTRKTISLLEPSREGDWWLKCPDLIGTGGLTSLLIPHIP